MPQATRSVVVNVPLEKFLSVVGDYERYPEFLPEVKKITVANRTVSSVDVTYEIEIIKTIHYTIRITATGNTVGWKLVESNLFKKNNGSWVLRAEGPDKTHATYNLELGFGLIPVPSAIVNKLTETSLPGLLENFRKRAESLYGPNAKT